MLGRTPNAFSSSANRASGQQAPGTGLSQSVNGWVDSAVPQVPGLNPNPPVAAPDPTVSGPAEAPIERSAPYPHSRLNLSPRNWQQAVGQLVSPKQTLLRMMRAKRLERGGPINPPVVPGQVPVPTPDPSLLYEQAIHNYVLNNRP